jgi:hypothetical protein
MAKSAVCRSVLVKDHAHNETEICNKATSGKVLKNSVRNRVKVTKNVRVLNPDVSVPLYTNFNLKTGIDQTNKLINAGPSIKFTPVETPLPEYS